VLDLWLLVLACGAGTYLWRGLGVALSGRIRPESEIFHWVAAVAYAMIAGLISRVILMPIGTLTETFLADRLIACAAALILFFFGRRNLFIGVMTGTGVFTALSYGRAALL